MLISAVAFDLMEEAADTGGLAPDGVGFLGGAVVYLARQRSCWPGAAPGTASGRASQQPSEDEQSGSGAAIAIGALLDGIPESVVLGLGLLGGGSVSLSVLAAVFISNVPEGLSSAAGMKRSGRSARYVFGVWGGIARGQRAGRAARLRRCWAARRRRLIAVITAVAAGAILTMIADTMIPEAFEKTRTPGPG